VAIAPPKTPRLREAFRLQRRAQDGQTSTGDFRLTFEVAWRAELHAHDTLATPRVGLRAAELGIPMFIGILCRTPELGRRTPKRCPATRQ
jgi:hypothetical protein